MSNRKKVTDLVCGMEIEVKDSTLHSNYMGKEYYFCSSDCLEMFEQDPNKYVKDSSDSEHEGHDHSGEGHHHHHHH